ncbi:MAG: exodeoxyribonuclease VII small subunit [Propionibacteriaceae bacterium]|nr:exodeoxyribonuclease VII small subunit [Propionibacteriaceae bacterium]
MSEQGRGDELSYEAARDELIEVVRKLEAGGASLAESMQLWERGEKLADICQRWLDGARAKVEEARRVAAQVQPEAGQ